jgi:hypothetical protein
VTINFLQWISDFFQLFDYKMPLTDENRKKKLTTHLILIQHKVFGDDVRMAQTLQNGVHEARIPMITQTDHTGRGVRWPHIAVQWWNTFLLRL